MSLRAFAKLCLISFLAGFFGVFGLLLVALLAVGIQPFFEPTEPLLPWVAVTPLEFAIFGAVASSAFALVYVLYVRLRKQREEQD